MDERTRAARFDRRSAPPARLRPAISDAVAAQARVRQGQRWLELGPGTGSVSVGFLRHPVRYLGLDQSAAMLGVFRARLPARPARAVLVQADANEAWPVATGTIDVVFAARAIHRMNLEHVAGEVLRVTDGRNATLLTGALHRPLDSVPAVMRSQMRAFLTESGFQGRDHDEAVTALVDALASRGWIPMAPTEGPRWSATGSPSDSMGSWEGQEGLAGLRIPPAVKASVLARLRVWAERHYGTLDARFSFEESYRISGVRSAEHG